MSFCTIPRCTAVHIAVPNRFHYDMAKKSLACGKHVMCEKPLAMNSRESAELVKLAAKSGCAAGVNYNIRYYPLCLEAAEQVRNGQLGRLFHVTGSYVQDWLVPRHGLQLACVGRGGGEFRAVADIGTHWLDLVQLITGPEVESVAPISAPSIRSASVPRVLETFSGKGSTPVATEPVPWIPTIMVRDVAFSRRCERLHVCVANDRGTQELPPLRDRRTRQALAWDSETPNELWIGNRDTANQRSCAIPRC